MFLRLAILVLLLISESAQAASPFKMSAEYDDHDQFMGVRLLGTVVIPTTPVNGMPVNELSGIAWDEDEGLLYAVSDAGRVYHLKPEFYADQLVNVGVTQAFRLTRDKKNAPPRERDAEGLAVRNGNNGKKNDTELLISLEIKPRIVRYTPQGVWIEKLALPEQAQNYADYYRMNKALEAVTEHPEFGIITTPEKPLKSAAKNKITLYGEKNQRWQLPRHSAANSSPVALEVLEDNSLLILERAYTSLFRPVVISLRQTWLNTDCEIQTGKDCQSKLIAEFDSSKGWDIDNFEGLARHQKNRFFIVSDDNASWLQRTLLSYFEIVTEPVKAGSPVE